MTIKKTLISLILAGGIAVNLGAYETDMYKFIPAEADVSIGDFTGNGIPDVYWYDKNKNGRAENNEMFFDLNEDGIPDVSYEDLIKNYLIFEKPQTHTIQYNKQDMRVSM